MKAYVPTGCAVGLAQNRSRAGAAKDGLPYLTHEYTDQFVRWDKKDRAQPYLNMRNKGRKYQKRSGNKLAEAVFPIR